MTGSSTGLSDFTCSLRPPALSLISVAFSIVHFTKVADLYSTIPAGGFITGSSGLVANSGILPFNFNFVGSASLSADLTTYEWNGALELAGIAFLLTSKESPITSSPMSTSTLTGFSYNL